jgi:phosphoribosylanthranilate isomerase
MTSVEEARLAEQHGAHAIGVLVGQRHASPDFVEPDIARAICLSLSPFTTPVLVTHLEDPQEIVQLVKTIPCFAVQLHSDLSSSMLQRLRGPLWPKKIIGKVSVQDETAISRIRDIEDAVDAIVLDSIDPATDRVGGTGLIHDWTISAQIVKHSMKPIILAGGLNPDNVRQAITTVRPWAVDVQNYFSYSKYFFFN